MINFQTIPAQVIKVVAVMIFPVVIAAATTRADELAPGTGQKHGIAMHGKLKHPAGYKHFSYVNPDAVKGGQIRFGVYGSYDTLNPLIVKGAPAAGLRGYIYESLLVRAQDEAFSLYGHIAEKVETPEDRSWVAFTLNPKAAFSDGHPITVEDVIFSHALLRDRGRPNHRSFYSKVEKVETPAPNTVRFVFKSGIDREMALIMGLMPILPKHQLTPEAFEKTTLAAPLGSGPYIISKIDPGRVIEYRKNPNYWARDLPAQRGRHNFGTLRYEYFRDVNTMREAFAKGVFDVQYEGDPGRWALGYDFPAAQRGDVVKRTFSIKSPSGMSALVFNTRRPAFANPAVRKAIVKLFDFEWLNQKLYHGLYVRTQSFFDRSVLASTTAPATEAEKKLLAPWIEGIAPEILDGSHRFPVSDGRGRNRKNIRAAVKELKAAGYVLKNGKMVNAATGRPFAFEILIVSQPQQKLLNGFVRTLSRIGMDVRIRQVDSSEYTRRRQSFDYDMIQFRWGASLSPGNEQNFRWSAKSAEETGSFNIAGAKSPAIDAMINALLAAKDHDTFVHAVRAYDRALLAGNYIIPLFHLPQQWVAHWKHLAFPKVTSLYGYQLDTWWDTRANSQ